MRCRYFETRRWPRQPERRVAPFSNSGNPMRQQRGLRPNRLVQRLLARRFRRHSRAKPSPSNDPGGTGIFRKPFLRSRVVTGAPRARYVQPGRSRCRTRIRIRASRTRVRARSPGSNRAVARSPDSSSSRIPAVSTRAAASSDDELSESKEGPAERRGFSFGRGAPSSVRGRHRAIHRQGRGGPGHPSRYSAQESWTPGQARG